MKANNVVPPGAGQSWSSCLALLSAVKRIQFLPVVAGFDGFVDTILHAVSERRSATEYSRLLTLRAFSRPPIYWQRFGQWSSDCSNIG
jgi:hypothetical protein